MKQRCLRVIRGAAIEVSRAPMSKYDELSQKGEAILVSDWLAERVKSAPCGRMVFVDEAEFARWLATPDGVQRDWMTKQEQERNERVQMRHSLYPEATRRKIEMRHAAERCDPCPVCGKKPSVQGVFLFAVRCMNPECALQPETKDMEGIEAAVLAWNDGRDWEFRAAPAKPDAADVFAKARAGDLVPVAVKPDPEKPATTQALREKMAALADAMGEKSRLTGKLRLPKKRVRRVVHYARKWIGLGGGWNMEPLRRPEYLRLRMKGCQDVMLITMEQWDFLNGIGLRRSKNLNWSDEKMESWLKNGGES